MVDATVGLDVSSVFVTGMDCVEVFTNELLPPKDIVAVADDVGIIKAGGWDATIEGLEAVGLAITGCCCCCV